MSAVLAFQWQALDTWIVVVAALAAVTCGLLGNYMVLRGMSMMGDAISHAVLPGLAGAFLFAVWLHGLVQAGTIALPGWLETIVAADPRAGPFMFLGAAIVGVLTALFTQVVHQYGRVDRSAAMGVVFTTLFALGLILMVRAADQVDLDADCVLYGAVELTPLDVVPFFGAEVPRAARTLMIILALNVLFILAFYKELKITSFDPDLATTLGIRAGVMHYLLMTLIAISCVAAFEAVGSILVVAMLIVPGATAHLLTDRLWVMLPLSAVVAIAAAFLGHLGAVTVPPMFGDAFTDTSTAGSMAAVGGGLFMLAALFSPHHGIVSRFVSRAALQARIVREDVLGLLYRLEEHGIDEPAPRFRARLREALHIDRARIWMAIVGLLRRGLLRRDGPVLRMTDAGRVEARTLVRVHRLWESYLVKHLEVPPDHVHGTAMRLEHITDRRLGEQLAAQVDEREGDPHGREIPG